MSSSSGSGLSTLKWQIALGLGAVGAVGLAYWYMKSSKNQTLHTVEEIKSTEENAFQRAQRYKNEGNELFKRGKYDEAIASYNLAIESIPEEYKTDLATFYQNRAAAYEQLKKWSSVIADCNKAIELNEKYEKAIYRRAKAYETVKNWKMALDDITLVCMLQNFGNQSALQMADRVLLELGKQNAAITMKNRKPIIPSKSFIKSYFASFSEDPVYKKLMETIDPLGQGELKGFLKAKLALATERYDEIVPACTEELNLSESESSYKIESMSLRGSFYFLLGMYEEASQDFTIIINKEDVDVRIRVNSLLKRASIYMQTGKVDECRADYETAIHLAPEISDIYHHRGQAKLLLDNTSDSRKDFEKAVELNPNYAVAAVQKCYTDYRHSTQLQDPVLLMRSLEDFRKVIEKFPSCTETYILFAQVQTERQEYQEAEELYKKAREIDPSNASVLIHEGLLLIQWKGDIEKAVNHMRKALELDPKCEFAYETLGTIEVQRGNLLIAIEMFEKAIQLARTEIELIHLCSLRDAAASQLKVGMQLGLYTDTKSVNKN